VTGCRTNSAKSFSLLLTILVLWATQGFGAKKKPPLHPVNLNTASSAELQQVPGIGPVTAEKILQARKSYGKFKSVNDLEAIRGIGPTRLDKMRKYLTVGAPATPATKKPPTHTTALAKAPPPKNAPAKAKPILKATPAATASEDEEP
jgi:competence ComEA-like helix-hairpin-helix protein